MTKKLEQVNKEKEQLYYEDPTLATKRAKEEQFKKDNDNILTASESLNNTFQNFAAVRKLC